MRARIWSFAVLLAIGLIGAVSSAAQRRRRRNEAGRKSSGPTSSSRMATAVAGRTGRREACGVDLGVGRRRLCRDAGPNLDRPAGRVAAA